MEIKSIGSQNYGEEEGGGGEADVKYSITESIILERGGEGLGCVVGNPRAYRPLSV